MAGDTHVDQLDTVFLRGRHLGSVLGLQKTKTWLLQLVGPSGHTGDADSHTCLWLNHPVHPEV